MTFIVNQDGVVFERTSARHSTEAAKILVFNPDKDCRKQTRRRVTNGRRRAWRRGSVAEESNVSVLVAAAVADANNMSPAQKARSRRSAGHRHRPGAGGLSAQWWGAGLIGGAVGYLAAPHSSPTHSSPTHSRPTSRNEQSARLLAKGNTCRRKRHAGARRGRACWAAAENMSTAQKGRSVAQRWAAHWPGDRRQLRHGGRRGPDRRCGRLSRRHRHPKQQPVKRPHHEARDSDGRCRSAPHPRLDRAGAGGGSRPVATDHVRPGGLHHLPRAHTMVPEQRKQAGIMLAETRGALRGVMIPDDSARPARPSGARRLHAGRRCLSLHRDRPGNHRRDGEAAEATVGSRVQRSRNWR